MRHSAENDSDRGGEVADCVEGLVVADDLKHVLGLRSSQPATGINRDTKIAPILHPENGRAVNQVCTGLRKESRRLGADDTPVAGRDDFGLVVAVGQTQEGKH